MTTSFMNALKNKASEVEASIASHVEALSFAALEAKDHLSKPSVTIDLVLNRNRIDVFFSSKPSEKIREQLKRQGFHYRSDPVPAWYHQDNDENREFLNRMFDCDLEQKAMVSSPALRRVEENVDPVIDPDPNLLSVPVVSPEIAKLRRQCNELAAYLKIELADLMLIAVDTLHKHTFSKDS